MGEGRGAEAGRRATWQLDLAINHSTSAIHGAAMEDAVAHWNQVGTPPMTLRTPEQITRFFDVAAGGKRSPLEEDQQ